MGLVSPTLDPQAAPPAPLAPPPSSEAQPPPPRSTRRRRYPHSRSRHCRHSSHRHSSSCSRHRRSSSSSSHSTSTSTSTSTNTSSASVAAAASGHVQDASDPSALQTAALQQQQQQQQQQPPPLLPPAQQQHQPPQQQQQHPGHAMGALPLSQPLRAPQHLAPHHRHTAAHPRTSRAGGAPPTAVRVAAPCGAPRAPGYLSGAPAPAVAASRPHRRAWVASATVSAAALASLAA